MSGTSVICLATYKFLSLTGGGLLMGWTLFSAGGQGVPDGGTTVMLLGAALVALGMARRFLKI